MFRLDELFKTQRKVKIQIDRKKYKLIDKQSQHAVNTALKRLGVSCKKSANQSNKTRPEISDSINSNTKSCLNEEQSRTFIELAVTLLPQLKAQGIPLNEITEQIEALSRGITQRKTHGLLPTDRSIPKIPEVEAGKYAEQQSSAN